MLRKHTSNEFGEMETEFSFFFYAIEYADSESEVRLTLISHYFSIVKLENCQNFRKISSAYERYNYKLVWIFKL